MKWFHDILPLLLYSIALPTVDTITDVIMVIKLFVGLHIFIECNQDMKPCDYMLGE